MFHRIHNTKGFYLIGLLIALLIIMILTGKYMTGDRESGIEPAITNIDKSKAAACSANRMQLQTQIQMWSISHPGEAPTIEKLRADRMSVPRCPANGEYTITEDGQVNCSIHSPAQVPREQN